MSDTVVTRGHVGATTLAAVARRIRVADIPTAWHEPLEAVWAFLGRHPDLRQEGHNVFVYLPVDHPGEVEALFGVEVTREFDAEGVVECRYTPGGEVLEAVHVGPYEGLGRTHEAVRASAEELGLRLSGTDWEVYGDWSDDPAALRTVVRHLLAAD